MDEQKHDDLLRQADTLREVAERLEQEAACMRASRYPVFAVRWMGEGEWCTTSAQPYARGHTLPDLLLDLGEEAAVIEFEGDNEHCVVVDSSQTEWREVTVPLSYLARWR